MTISQKLQHIQKEYISKQEEYISKIKELGTINRASAPLYEGDINLNSISNATIFDFDTIYITENKENKTTCDLTHMLFTKIQSAFNYINTENKNHTPKFILTNGHLSRIIADNPHCDSIFTTPNNLMNKSQIETVGKINNITIYVDLNMYFNDNRIFIGYDCDDIQDYTQHMCITVKDEQGYLI